MEGDAKTEWENIEDQRNMETVNRLAEKYNIRPGKWMLHISSEWVDKVRWRRRWRRRRRRRRISIMLLIIPVFSPRCGPGWLWLC